MSGVRRPLAWFSLSLLALSASGAVLLRFPAFTVSDARETAFYGTRLWWMAALDAVSAVCGAGLLHAPFDEAFTTAGRWLLAGLGVAGALAYLLTALAVMRRAFGDRCGPGAAGVAAAFAAVLVLGAGISAVDVFAGERDHLGAAALRGISAAGSLGWTTGERDDAVWPTLCAAGVGAAGWPLWVLLLRRKGVAWRALLRWPLAYAALLAMAALLYATAELPRGHTQRGPLQRAPAPELRPLPERFGRGMEAALLAAAAGMPTADSPAEQRSEAAKLLLAGLVLLGGLGGSAAGALKFTLVVWAGVGLWGVFRRGADPEPAAGAGAAPRPPRSRLDRTRPARAACGVLAVVTILTLGVAVGLLLIEARVSSPFSPRPTLGDALLEAVSAVGGAGISTGLTETLTAANLSSGMHDPSDDYQYGTLWLILALLAGRVLPLLVFARVAGEARGEADTPAWPLM